LQLAKRSEKGREAFADVAIVYASKEQFDRAFTVFKQLEDYTSRAKAADAIIAEWNKRKSSEVAQYQEMIPENFEESAILQSMDIEMRD